MDSDIEDDEDFAPRRAAALPAEAPPAAAETRAGAADPSGSNAFQILMAPPQRGRAAASLDSVEGESVPPAEASGSAPQPADAKRSRRKRASPESQAAGGAGAAVGAGDAPDGGGEEAESSSGAADATVAPRAGRPTRASTRASAGRGAGDFFLTKAQRREKAEREKAEAEAADRLAKAEAEEAAKRKAAAAAAAAAKAAAEAEARRAAERAAAHERWLAEQKRARQDLAKVNEGRSVASIFCAPSERRTPQAEDEAANDLAAQRPLDVDDVAVHLAPARQGSCKGAAPGSAPAAAQPLPPSYEDWPWGAAPDASDAAAAPGSDPVASGAAPLSRRAGVARHAPQPPPAPPSPHATLRLSEPDAGLAAASLRRAAAGAVDGVAAAVEGVAGGGALAAESAAGAGAEATAPWDGLLKRKADGAQADGDASLWCEAFRPTKSSEVCGNSGAVAQLRTWLRKWVDSADGRGAPQRAGRAAACRRRRRPKDDSDSDWCAARRTARPRFHSNPPPSLPLPGAATPRARVRARAARRA